MTGPQDDRTTEQVAAPSVSTAASGGGTDAAPAGRRWHWSALPDHLGRARTSTVILAVLFLAVFALYLNVRPDDGTTRSTPAGGGSDVEAPVNPLVPSEPTTPEPSEAPAPTTSPEETPTSTTTRPPSSTTPSTTAPTTEPSTPTGTSDPAGPTDGETGQETPATTSPSAP